MQIKQPQIQLPQFTKTNLQKFSTLPQAEPTTNVRRLSDRIIYEISLPQVKTIADISINKINNSIEIKAITKNQAWFKIMQINLPILNYNFEKEKLILELEAK